MPRRVVITGLGTVNSLAHAVGPTWDALLEGRSGISRITRFDASQMATQIAGEIRGLDTSPIGEDNVVRKLDPFTVFGMLAGIQAMQDAGFGSGAGSEGDEFGCIFGVGIGGLTDIEATKETLQERGPRRVSPFFIPKIMMNAVAGQLSMRFALRGPNFVTASACASSNHAMGLAFRAVKHGEADMMLTGGAEATITPLGVSGFCALRAMSTRNDAPEKASRPFDRNRDGFVMGEGGGAAVFEEYEHAKRRGARIYAEVVGFGMTADGHHITAPDPDGAGAVRAMRAAIREARLQPDAVDYVNAHGTSTELNDAIETKALKSVFGEHARKLAISSTKSMLGHLLGGAGAVELVATAMSIATQRVHPTINQEEADPACDLDYVPNTAREMPVRVALSNSNGFGGHNATILLARL
ncbi:MAG: 3-oxoacyl-[acyl-carrier-protein] synthase 2 [Planctomycetes bacterium]|nr:3-oxoacyl-[acyl-carrier-protein] synthase 2 [Planctomycetota bacterium]